MAVAKLPGPLCMISDIRWRGKRLKPQNTKVDLASRAKIRPVCGIDFKVMGPCGD